MRDRSSHVHRTTQDFAAHATTTDRYRRFARCLAGSGARAPRDCRVARNASRGRGPVGAGLATFFCGLLVTVPVVGHATWHAYEDLIGKD